MLELKGLKKLFDGITVLNGVDITFQLGTKIGLSGGNGTGKSTLLNIAAGFLTPDEGSIILNGDDITHFEFSKKSFRTIAPAVIGIQLKNIEDFSLLVERLKKHNFRFDYLNKKQDLFQFLI